MSTTPKIATMTVQVTPELPDDFAATIHRAVRRSTGAGLIREGVRMVAMLDQDSVAPRRDLPSDVDEALGVLYRYAESVSPERPER